MMTNYSYYETEAGYKIDGKTDAELLTAGGGTRHHLTKEDAFFHSSRNFPNGTLIETDIDYSQDYGDQFLLEIKGNSYGGGLPLSAKIQGYIYLQGNNPLISISGWTTLSYWKIITALNLNGKLCFWFPYLSYWQGFDVKVTRGYGGLEQGQNRVINVSDSPDPVGTKRVSIYLNTIATEEYVNDNFATIQNLNNYQPLGQYVRIGGDNTTGNNILIGWTGSQAQLTVDATTIGNLWHSNNFNPNNFHKTDTAYGINNGSDLRPNETWFDYDWAETGYAGSVINFSGFAPADQRYNTELFGEYNNGGNIFGLRTRNGDAGGAWNPVRLIWHDGNFSPDTKVNKSGDTITGALNIYSNSQIGRWKGADINTNYLIWRNHGDTKDIAYIGADGNSAAGGGVGDGFAIVAPSGDLQLVASSVVTIQGHIPWTAGNFNPDLYLTTRAGYHTALVAKTDFPLSFTDYAGDPALTNFQSYYGTSFHFKGGNTWYNRLDFPVFAEKAFLYQGINTTDMTLRGSIDIIPVGVTSWTSNNFNPAQYVKQSDLNTQLGNYPTLAGTQTFSGTNTFDQNIIIPFYPTLLNHATSYGFVADYVDIREGNILNYVAATYMLKNQVATNNVLGGIRLIIDTVNNIAPNAVTTVIDRSYAVQLNSLNQAVVNVPWIDYGNHATVGYAKLAGDPQTFSNTNIFTKPPRVPSANNPDEAIPFGQATEIAISTVRENFLTRTTTLPSNVTYDLSNYGSPMVTNIVIKGNPNGELYIDGLDQGMTIKIMNTSALNLIVRFDGGSLATGIGQKTWIEVHRDSEGDLIKNDTQNTIIL